MTAAVDKVDREAPFRVLALDGGGIRGYYTARLLAGLLTHFEVSLGRPSLDLGKGFDLIAGTSTGAILGSALAAGHRPEPIAELYLKQGPKIFPGRFPEFDFDLPTLSWVTRHWNRPNASAPALTDALNEVFGDLTFEQLWTARNVALTIPAVSIVTYGPKVFKTPHFENLTHDRPIRLVDACLASAAAPLYFPLHALGKSGGYIRNDLFVDGGLWANNPSLVGLIEAMTILAARKEERPIHIFSFGTCEGPIDQSHLMRNPKGGLKTWNAGKDITELALSASANSLNLMTRLFANALSLRAQPVVYARIPDPEMTPQQQACIGMDRADPEAFEAMEHLATTNEARILSSMKTPGEDALHHLAEVFRHLPVKTT